MNATTCDRCGAELGASSMSYFNTDTICMACRKRERAHPKFEEARRAEHEAVKAGNTNFPGATGRAGPAQATVATAATVGRR